VRSTATEATEAPERRRALPPQDALRPTVEHGGRELRLATPAGHDVTPHPGRDPFQLVVIDETASVERIVVGQLELGHHPVLATEQGDNGYGQHGRNLTYSGVRSNESRSPDGWIDRTQAL
jgi:hypothetical protein